MEKKKREEGIRSRKKAKMVKCETERGEEKKIKRGGGAMSDKVR